MDITIEARDRDKTQEIAIALGELKSELENVGLDVQVTDVLNPRGTKDGSLILALTLLGLSLQVIQTVLSVLQFWSEKKNLRVEIEAEEKIIEFNGKSAVDLTNAIEELRGQTPYSKIRIIISRN